MSKNARLILLVVVAALVLSACTAGANPAVDTADSSGNTAGFLLGLWHGLIVPITFIISLFTENINVYEVHNSGGWYDFGFVLGASSSLGGSGASAARR